MQIFDTHCHYNLEPIFAGDAAWQAQWQQARDNGVVGSVVIGTNLADCQLAIRIASQDPRLGAAIGIHPGEYNEVTQKAIQRTTNLKEALENALLTVQTQIEELQPLVSTNKVVALGETGLDYFHFHDVSESEKEVIKDVQRAALRAHLKLADGKLPVILHIRDQQEEAYWDVINILKELNYGGSIILHCVSGPFHYVDEALSLGAYVSVAGNVTYKTAEHLRETVQRVPAERLLVETDAPFLPPVPYRGQSCEPWMISKTVEYLANELHVDADQLLQNSYRLFPTLQSSL